MQTDPVAFLREDLPALFNKGVAQLEAKAASDDKAKARLEDTRAAKGAVRVVFEGDGGGELYLCVDGGAMKAAGSAPAGVPVRLAVAAPVDAARAALEQVAEHDLLASEKAPKRIARSASAEVEKVLAGHQLAFHVTFTDLPTDPDEVTLRIAIGSSEPPANPKFTATVSWDDIEDVRSGDMTPQQLFGRLKLTGDASQAMALGMALMQRRR
ncbi:MAG: SCP2 sterol-binding domain-containing protein [Sandaracinaceae bacterium]|nr:SCP2 sterol-binding domain-containing protein [Sandaracinaceae bacterium]